MKEVEIFTDGACSGNPGPGGYAAIVKVKNKETVVSGAEKHTTNNRMELIAVIKGLEVLTTPCKVKLYSDSAYVCNAILEDWIAKWRINRWKNSQKKPVLNKDLWLTLNDLLSVHKVEFIKVKGHADVEYNNKCDEIARSEIKKLDFSDEKPAEQ